MTELEYVVYQNQYEKWKPHYLGSKRRRRAINVFKGFPPDHIEDEQELRRIFINFITPKLIK